VLDAIAAYNLDEALAEATSYEQGFGVGLSYRGCAAMWAVTWMVKVKRMPMSSVRQVTFKKYHM
jgi:hypothetical protein